MGAENPIRRTKTAAEMAARLGVSVRTIRNVVAEPRDDYLARAATNRKNAVGLRNQGLKYREIAEEMGCSIGTVSKLLHDARKYASPGQEQASA
jgi:DNA-directed RNA polymerase specialized sigma24 family protein